MSINLISLYLIPHVVQIYLTLNAYLKWFNKQLFTYIVLIKNGFDDNGSLGVKKIAHYSKSEISSWKVGYDRPFCLVFNIKMVPGSILCVYEKYTKQLFQEIYFN